MLFALALIAAAQAQDAVSYSSTAWRADADELHYVWGPELAGTVGLFATWSKLHHTAPTHIGGVSEPSGLDAAPHPRWNPGAQAWSDALALPNCNSGLNLPLASILGVGVWGGLRDHSLGSGAVHSLVVVEAYGADIVVTETLKLLISRPRPHTSTAFAQAWPDVVAGAEHQSDMVEEGHWDAYKSMPSGHTSGTGAYSFAIATLVWRDASLHGRGTPALALAVYGGAGALTATVGTLRVVGGMHHVSDTIVGGLIGAGVGTGVAWLHTGLGRSGAAGLGAATSEGGAPMMTIGGTW